MKKISLVASCVGSLIALAACSGSAEPAPAPGTDQNFTSAKPGAPIPADYETRSAKDKLDILWSRELATKYDKFPAWPSALSVLKGVTFSRLSATMDTRSDFLPSERAGMKQVHTFGSVAKVELIADATTRFTGMFKGGIGLARFSLAHDPNAGGFTPGLALKLLIDGQPSQNLQAMWKIDGHDNDGSDPQAGPRDNNVNDFFFHPFSNIIPDPAGTGTKLIADIFSRVNNTPGHLDIDELARIDRTGALVAKSAAPPRIFFTPTAAVRAVKRANSSAVDFRDDLAKIPINTVVYDVLAAEEDDGAAQVHIGQLVLRSELVAAHDGDEVLFFKHTGHGEGKSGADLLRK